jgi:glycine cleavage system H lipoate-binding protein
MVPAIVAVTVAVFLMVSCAVNWIGELSRARRRAATRRRTLQRAEVAEAPPEVKSLTRVAIDDPLADVLVWGTDPAVLAQVRRTLSLGGYRVDSVTTLSDASRVLGAEPFDLLLLCAEGEVTHLDELLQVARLHEPRPEIIVVHPTGHPLAVPSESVPATSIELPVTDRRLLRQVHRVLDERAKRLDEERPKVRLVTGGRASSPAKHVINVPAGLFIAPNHTWISIQPNGEVRIGLDDFALKLIAAAVDDVELPLLDDRVGKTSPLFSLYRGAKALDITSPINGQVTTVNDALHRDPALLSSAPYTKGWVCTLKANNLAEELRDLRLGEDSVNWYVDEVERHLRTREARRLELHAKPD